MDTNVEVLAAINKAAGVLHAVEEANLFEVPNVRTKRLHVDARLNDAPSSVDSLWQKSQAEEITAQLYRLAETGALTSVPSVLEAVVRQLSAHKVHPLVALVVASACIKALSRDAWEDDGESSLDSAAEEASVPDSSASTASTNPLAGMEPAAMGQYLLQKLNEPEHHLHIFTKLANLGPDTVWELLQEASEEVRKDGALATVADGSRPRTAGGIFIKLAKSRKAFAAKKAAENPLPPGLVLREYQQRAVDLISKEGGNWVVAAPTNTGKTAMFIELARRLLVTQRDAKIVVVVPTVSLVTQQCTAFEKSPGFRPVKCRPGDAPATPVVDWFCGDKPLPFGQWKPELSLLSVIVIEAQSIHNLVKDGQASLADVHLLVLDECHHADADTHHPYSNLMRECAKLPKEKQPQVLGFSASPVNGKTEEVVYTKLDKLFGLLDAKLHVISDSDPLVHQVAPAAEEAALEMPSREVDGKMQEWLRRLMLSLAVPIDAALKSMLKRPGLEASCRVVAGRVSTLPTTGGQPMEEYNQLCKWMNQVAEVAHVWELPNLISSIQTLEVLRRAEALCDDVGHECALQFVAQRMLILAPPQAPSGLGRKVKPHAQAATASTAAAEITTLPGALEALQYRAQHGPSAVDIAAAAKQQHPMASLPRCADISLTPGDLCRLVLALLSCWGDLVVSATLEPQALAALQAAGIAGTAAALMSLPPASRHCTALIQQVVSVMVPGVMLERPSSFPASAGKEHPKVAAVFKYLLEFKQRPAFHGIIFCRSRQAAHFLAELLRMATLPCQRAGGAGKKPGLLDFLDSVELFVGHGASASAKGRLGGGGVLHLLMGTEMGLAASGMNVQKQKAVLESFKVPGRRLLVATNAAEEGIDLPCCEFVVRFSPAASGVQRVQGRGRARKLGAQYLCLMQVPPPGSLHHGGNDLQLHNKSGQEENALIQVMKECAE